MYNTKEAWERDVEKFAAEYELGSPFDAELAEEFIGCSFEEQRISYRFAAKDWMKNERGQVHGGMIGAMFDCAIGMVAIYAAGWDEAATMDLNISFLRPLESSDRALVHTYIVKNGRSVIRLRAEMVSEETGRLVATATGNWKPLNK